MQKLSQIRADLCKMYANHPISHHFFFICYLISKSILVFGIKVVGKQGCVMVPRKRINYGLLRSIIRDVASIVEMEDRQVLDVFFA